MNADSMVAAKTRRPAPDRLAQPRLVQRRAAGELLGFEEAECREAAASSSTACASRRPPRHRAGPGSKSAGGQSDTAHAHLHRQ
jgi:hypothetical protein